MGSAGGPELAKPGTVLAASAEHGITLGGIESVSPQAQPRSYHRCWISRTSRGLRWPSSVSATASFPTRDRINQFSVIIASREQDPASFQAGLCFFEFPNGGGNAPSDSKPWNLLDSISVNFELRFCYPESVQNAVQTVFGVPTTERYADERFGRGGNIPGRLSGAGAVGECLQMLELV